jgi:hypothetical protein
VVLIGGVAWARGLGFGRGASDQTASGEAVAEPVSLETTSDRWAPPVSVLCAVVAYRFGPGSLLGWAWLLGLGRLGAPGPFFIFPFSFSFLFEFKNQIKVSKMHNFEYFQVCIFSIELEEMRWSRETTKK